MLHFDGPVGGLVLKLFMGEEVWNCSKRKAMKPYKQERKKRNYKKTIIVSHLSCFTFRYKLIFLVLFFLSFILRP